MPCIPDHRSSPHADRDTECAVEHDTKSDFMSCASATGDHNDFRAAANATAAAAREATKKMEMDINLKSAVYGISLDKFTVAYDSSELQRMAFAKAYSSANDQRLGYSLPGTSQSAPIKATYLSTMNTEADGIACSNPSARTPRKRASGRTLGDTCVMTEDEVWRGQRKWQETEQCGGDEKVHSNARGRAPEELSTLPDLQSNFTMLQNQLLQRRRMLEQRKADRRRVEREETIKVRKETETISMIQAAIQKMMQEFDTLDDNFDRRASSRASSASWMDAQDQPNEYDENTDGAVIECVLEQETERLGIKRDGEQGNVIIEDRKNRPFREKLESSHDLVTGKHTGKHTEKSQDLSVNRDAENKEASFVGDGKEMGFERDVHLQKIKQNRPLLSLPDVGPGDQTCSPEGREFWKRAREKEQERNEFHAMSHTRQKVAAAPQDEPNCVYITYESGDHQGRKAFIGQTTGGKRSGKGVLTWLDGSKYCGEWSNDQPNGFGQEKYQNGSFYVGGFKNDARHGFGEFAATPEMSYSGQWEGGQMHGIVYITQLSPEGQVKIIPARAERGEVQRRPNDPLFSILAIKQKVEVAISFARNASTEARDLAWSMSMNATQIAKHVIASRSPSPFTVTETPCKSPIPPIASTATPSIENDIGWKTPNNLANVARDVDEKAKSKVRPVSAGCVGLWGCAGLPPLPSNQKRNRQRPVTAHPTQTFQDSAALHPHSRHESAHHTCQQVLRSNPTETELLDKIKQVGLRVRLAEDGLSSVAVSPAPVLLDALHASLEMPNTANDFDIRESEDVEVDISVFSDEDLETALGMLLADKTPGRAAESVSHDVNQANSLCTTPNDLVSLLIGEFNYVNASTSLTNPTSHVSSSGTSMSRSDQLMLVQQLAPEKARTTSGVARCSSSIEPDADQCPPLDESVLHTNYKLVRFSRPHVTGCTGPYDSLNTSASAVQLDAKSLITHPSQSARPLSPYVKQYPPTHTLCSMSPRAMRLRPLPRSVGSHVSSEYAHTYRQTCSPTSSSVQGVSFGSPVGHKGDSSSRMKIEGENTTASGRIINHQLLSDREIVRPGQTRETMVQPERPVKGTPTVTSENPSDMTIMHNARLFGDRPVKIPVTTTTTITSTTTTTTTTVLSTGERSTERSMSMAQETAIAANQDRMLVAIVTVAAAEIVGKICDDVAKNLQALANAETFVRLSAAAQDKWTALSTPSGPSGPPFPVACKNDNNREPALSKNILSSIKERELDQEEEDIGKSWSSKERAEEALLQQGESVPVRTTFHAVHFEDLDNELGVIKDDDNHGDANFDVELFAAIANFSPVQSPGGSRYKKTVPTSNCLSNDGVLAVEDPRQQSLASPAELARRLVSKFSTGFGLASHEQTEFSRTFVETLRLRCFVGFINAMDDHHWLQVQNRFVEDAAKTHGVPAEAETFVREEAFSWMLERHSRNPVNKDCMVLCGIASPLQTLVSAAYEVTSGLGGSGVASPLVVGRYDIVALRILILHSFVETCWRVWREMITRASLQSEEIRSSGLGTAAVLGSRATPRPLLPWSQPTNLERLSVTRQYVSPLAKRVRPGSSNNISRPFSGEFQRKGEDTTEKYAPMLPPSQPQRIEANAQTWTTHKNNVLMQGYNALGYVREELSRSVFANIAEAFAWFDLDRRRFVSLSEVDIGLKNLRIFDCDVVSIFALCSNLQLRYGTREPEIGEIQFARLFQWNDQLTSDGKGLLLCGEPYCDASHRAQQQQRRIIEKVKAFMQLRSDKVAFNAEVPKVLPDPNLTGVSVSGKRSKAAPPCQDGRSETSQVTEDSLGKAHEIRPTSASKLCALCKRSHDNDFVPGRCPSTLPSTSGQMESQISRPNTHSNPPIHREPLRGKMVKPNAAQLSVGWDYATLANEVEDGYKSFSPHAILGVMVSSVLEKDIRRPITCSRGQEEKLPPDTMTITKGKKYTGPQKFTIQSLTGKTQVRTPRATRIVRL